MCLCVLGCFSQKCISVSVSGFLFSCQALNYSLKKVSNACKVGAKSVRQTNTKRATKRRPKEMADSTTERDGNRGSDRDGNRGG